MWFVMSYESIDYSVGGIDRCPTLTAGNRGVMMKTLKKNYITIKFSISSLLSSIYIQFG